MAKYYSSTFGKISGKHGTAVSVIMKDGTTYLREYTKPSNPRTDKQQAHRAKFALSSKALVPFNPIFKMTMGVTNGISSARSYAFKNAIVGEYPNFEMNYEKLIFSSGPVGKMFNLSCVVNEGVMSVRWDYEKMYNCNANDNVSLVVFNKGANQAIHIDDAGIRSDKGCNVDIHDQWADCELYVWAYLKSGDKFSDSVFVGKCNPDNESERVGNDVIDDFLGDDLCSSHSNSVTHYGIYEAIMSFVMIIYNLLGLFSLVEVRSKTSVFANDLIHNIFEVSLYTNSSYKERVLYCNSNSICNGVQGGLPPRYQRIFAPILIPMVGSFDKLGANLFKLISPGCMYAKTST